MLCILLMLLLIPASAFAEEIEIIPVEETDTDADAEWIAIVPESKAASTEVLRSFTDSYVNPLYPELEGAEQPGASIMTASVSSAYEYTPCEGQEGLAALLKQAMLKREGTLYFLMHSDTATELKMKSLVELACAHSGAPKEGDYLFIHYGSANLNCSELPAENGYDYEGQIRLTYLTTAQQENQVDSAVSALMDELALDGMNETSKALAVYAWVCKKVAVGSDTQNSAYAALVNGKASYKGFSALLYRLFLTAGLDSRAVFGQTGGKEHGWNIVKIGDRYYNADAAADAGKETFTAFLKGSADFSAYTLNNEYRTIAFKRAYPMSETSINLEDLKPVIVTQPQDVKTYAYKTVSFTMKAEGAGLSYQWQYRLNEDDVGGWYNSSLSSATTPTLTIKTSSAMDGRQFRCKVTNAAGTTYTEVATLRFKADISQQPSSVTVQVGDTASFTVKGKGNNLQYQWQYRTSSSGSWNNCTLSGYNTPTYSVVCKSYHDGYQYRCKVTNDVGGLYSHEASLTVLSQTTITSQPASVTAELGDTVKFSVKASGTKLSYQWQYKKNSSDGWHDSGLSSATTPTLTVKATNSVNGYQYRCKVTGSVDTVNSNTVKLTVVPKTEITSQPASLTAEVGATAKFTVQASGSDLSYQWQYRTSSSGSWNNSGLSSAKTATLSIKATNSVNGYQYRCKVTSSTSTVYSNIVTLTVVPKTEITSQPSSVTAQLGTTAKFSVTAAGSNLSYQWQYRTSKNGSWNNSGLSSAKTPTLTIKATSSVSGYQYRCKVTSPTGTVYSYIVTLTVTQNNQTVSLNDRAD